MSVDYVYPIASGQSEGNAPKQYAITCSNTKAEVVASGFFNHVTQLKVSDFLFVRCTDGLALLDVTGINPTTVTSISTGGGTEIISNGIQTTTGGSTTETITGNFLPTDVVQVTEHSVGTNQAYVVEAYASQGSVSVSFNTDPGTNTKYNLTVLR